jgi:hypothetical protein
VGKDDLILDMLGFKVWPIERLKRAKEDAREGKVKDLLTDLGREDPRGFSSPRRHCAGYERPLPKEWDDCGVGEGQTATEVATPKSSSSSHKIKVAAPGRA